MAEIKDPTTTTPPATNATPAAPAADPNPTPTATKAEAPKKRKIIRALPAGSASEDKAERSHLLASRWQFKGAPLGGAHANRAYETDAATAAYMVARKGWSYVGSDGKPSDEKASLGDAEMRHGTEEWFKLQPEDRVGSTEWREAQMQKKLEGAESAPQPEAK